MEPKSVDIKVSPKCGGKKIAPKKTIFRKSTEIKRNNSQTKKSISEIGSGPRTDVSLLKAYQKRCDLTYFTWNGLVAKVLDYPSLDNIVVSRNVPVLINLEIMNTSKQDLHRIQNITHAFPNKNIKADFPKTPVEVPPDDKITIKISATFSDEGDYLDAFLLTHSSDNLLAVRLVFRVLSPAVACLQSIEPYKKVENVIVNKIVGEERVVYGNRPKFSRPVTQVTYKAPEKFDLPKDLVSLLDKDLQEFPGMTSQQELRLVRIKNLLEVPDKTNPLNSDNYTKLLTLLLQIEEHQMWKDIRDYDADGQVLKRCSGHLFELEVPGLAEHRPSLVIGDKIYIKESKDSIVKYEGYVHKVLEKSVHISLSSRFEDQFIRNKKFLVSFTFNRHPVRMEHQAVQLAEKHRVSKHLFDIHCKHDIKVPSKFKYKWVNKHIETNKEQKQAVYHILNKSSYPAPYIIFGPPGTGKTATLTEAIMQIYLTLPKSNVLLLAPSNNAANEVVKRLAKQISKNKMFRYMAPSFPYDLIPEEVRPYVNYERGVFFQPSVQTLSCYRILVSTLTNAGRLVNIGMPPNSFDYVLIDESGHATEPETLIAISGILSNKDSRGQLSGQLVLVGDPQQLGAVIHSKLAMRYGFDKSMLERLMTTVDVYRKSKEGQHNQIYITKLVNNYRSHSTIMKVPNDLFYDGDLVSKGNDLIDIFLGWEDLPNPKIPIIFHGICGVDQREKNSPSFFNLQEVSCVMQYLQKLLGTKRQGTTISEDHIGIIAPYKKQVYKIRDAYNKNYTKSSKLMIGSVEQIQGQERLIIIISTTRSTSEYLPLDHKFHLGFLRNPKRMNVALTRAKALLIVIGNPHILVHDKNWMEFLQYCQENNCTKGTNFQLKSCPEIEEITLHTDALSLEDEICSPHDKADFSRCHR